MGDSALEPKSCIIRRLPQQVIDRIAAGEVIHRPVSALKELIENSLDAGATTIQVSVKDGGLKFLQIQDNGHGIQRDDLPILCHRFTTSKIEKYEDLDNIATYGFRGEALASISQVARLTVTTRKSDSMCAYTGKYADGELTEPVRSCAGNVGTKFTIEDLFYNNSLRREILKSPADEYSRIFDVVTKYALHNTHVGFSLTKSGENATALRTTAGASRRDTLGLLYGNSVAKDVLELPTFSDSKFGLLDADGCISGPNSAHKKSSFVLFINHRLVECASLKRAVDNLYTSYLPKHTHPFVYLSLQIAPNQIDVNVHPSKQTVHFLYESEIVQRVVLAIESALIQSGQSRSFLVPTISFSSNSAARSAKATDIPSREADQAGRSEVRQSTDYVRKLYDHELVRKDSRERSLEHFFQPQDSSKRSGDVVRSLSVPAGSAPPNVDCAVNASASSALNVSCAVNASASSAPNVGCAVNASASSALNVDCAVNASASSAPNVGCAVNGSASSAPKPIFSDCRTSLPSDENADDSGAQSLTPCSSGSDSSLVDNQRDQTTHTRALPSTSGFQAASVLPIVPSSLVPAGVVIEPVEDVEILYPTRSTDATKYRPIVLSSVLSLQQEVCNACAPDLRALFRRQTFVGSVNGRQALVQYETGLFLMDTERLSEELFYQTLLFRFGNFGCLQLQEPANLMTLLRMAMQCEGSVSQMDATELDAFLTQAIELLNAKADMLWDYFSLELKDGMLIALPMLIPGYTPQLEGLPQFLLRVVTDVDWESEKECFRTLCREIARFYAVKERFCAGAYFSRMPLSPTWKQVIAHQLYPVFKARLLPPAEFERHRCVLKLTDMHELYKTFERC